MPRLGFIDDNLQNFHADTYAQLLRTELKDRGWQLVGATARQTPAGREWAAKNNVPYVDSIAALAGQVDGVMILAPSNPGVHLEMVQEASQLQVPLYVDKTFAPDHATARAIFATADAAGLPLVSTSALRYTDEVPRAVAELKGEPILQVQTWGSGPSLAEYLIHPLELAVSIMGGELEAVRRQDSGPLVRLDLRYTRGRLATVHFYPNNSAPYAAVIATASQTKVVHPIAWTMFRNTLAAALDFFEARRENIDRRETLAIRRVMDLCATAARDQWVTA